MYIKKMFGFVIPEMWDSRIHMYDKYGHISPFCFPPQNRISKSERDSPLSPEFSHTELEDDESYKDLKKHFEKIGDSYLSSIQVDARIPLLRQTEFKMGMSTVNSTLSDELAKIAINIPENNAIPENIVRQDEPAMQRCANSLADVIDRYSQEFRSYLSLKELENTGYDRYLYLSEKADNTCQNCESRHGQVYSMQDLERDSIIPPIHPNCKCSVIAMDRNAEERYNADKQEFLDKIEEELYNSIGGIYRLDPDTGLVPIQTVFPTNSIITNDSSDPKWYEELRNWASNFGEDAKAAWDDFYDDATKRRQNIFKDVPSFLDYLTFGIVSVLYNSLNQRHERMLQDSNVYTVANWLLLGIPDVINGAINPDEPFSFDHWMNSLETATLLYGGYQTAKNGITASNAMKVEPSSRLLDELANSGVKYNPEDVVTVTKTADGKLVWLENGSDTAGLNHIIKEHATNFANKGISQKEIPDYISQALSKGKVVGYQGRGIGRPIYEFAYNGTMQRVAITVGSNGFIVGANPAS